MPFFFDNFRQTSVALPLNETMQQMKSNIIFKLTGNLKTESKQQIYTKNNINTPSSMRSSDTIVVMSEMPMK